MDVLITMCKSLLQQAPVSLVSGVLLQSAVHPWWSENVTKGVVEAWRQHLLLTDCAHLPGRMSQAKRPLLREKPMLVILDLAPLLPLEFPYHTQNVQHYWHIMVPFVRQPSEGKFFFSPLLIKMKWTIFSCYLMSQIQLFFTWMWRAPRPSCQHFTSGRKCSCRKWMIKHGAAALERCCLKNKTVSIVKQPRPLSDTPLKLVTNRADARSIR